MTPEQRKAAIDAAWDQCVAAKTREGRVQHWNAMLKLIADRPPAEKARLEAQRFYRAVTS